MTDVFVSYLSEDRERVRPLVNALEQAGFSVWWDQHIRAGAQWDRSIENAIADARCVVAVLTGRSLESTWVRAEAMVALDANKLVPVLLDDVELPLALRTVQCVRLEGVSNGAQPQALVDALRRYRAGEPLADASTPVPSRSSTRAQRARRLAIGAAACVVAIAAALTVYMQRERDSTPPERTIAVLPFEDLSGDPNYAYIGEGLGEELLNRLANVPGLRVSARTSSNYFKNRHETAQNIGRLLGVLYLLQGSVRKSSDTLRVTAQLVDTRTGYHIWSHRFDRTRADVFAIQDDVSFAVLKALNAPLIEEARKAAMRGATTNHEALDSYLRARHAAQKWTLEENNKAIALYEKAIALDPKFATAYVALAQTVGARRQIANLPPNDPFFLPWRGLVEKAIEIDPDCGDAHALMGRRLVDTFDLEGAERELLLAESLNPNGDVVLDQLTQFYAFAGFPPERAIEYAQRWVTVDPLNAWATANVGIAQLHALEPAAALRTMDALIQREPDFWVAYYIRNGALMDLGRPEEVLASAKKMIEMGAPGVEVRSDIAGASAALGNLDDTRTLLAESADGTGGYVSPSGRAGLMVMLGDNEGALRELERAYDEVDGELTANLHNLGFITAFGNDPRFQRLVNALGQERRIAYAIEKKGLKLAAAPAAAPLP